MKSSDRGLRQPAAAFLSQPAGVKSFGVPKQGDLRACEAFGVECYGASVLLIASRLAEKSGSRLPHSKAFGSPKLLRELRRIFRYHPGMTSAYPTDTRPAPAAAIALAREALEKHDSCFWFRSAEAPLETIAEVQLVIRRLRQYGNRASWETAYRIHQCL